MGRSESRLVELRMDRRQIAVYIRLFGEEPRVLKDFPHSICPGKEPRRLFGLCLRYSQTRQAFEHVGHANFGPDFPEVFLALPVCTLLCCPFIRLLL
jgi:hypothetical protein